MTCDCGFPLLAGERVCPECGHAVNQARDGVAGGVVD